MLDPGKYVEDEIDSFNRKGIAFIKRAVGAFLISLIKPLATASEALFRKEFGERYFTGWNIIAGSGLIYISAIASTLVRLRIAGISKAAEIQFQISDYLSQLFGLTWLVVFLIFSWLHRRRIRQRTAQGILWHSYSCGCSRVSDKWQPAYPITLGIVLYVCHLYGPGVLMIASGFVSFKMRAREAALFYTRVLDVVDAKIEQEQLSDAVLKKSNPQATSGFVAPLPAYVSVPHRNKFLQGMGAQARPGGAGSVATAHFDSATESNAQSPSAQSTQPAGESPEKRALRAGLRAVDWVRTRERKTKVFLAILIGMFLLSWGAGGYYAYLNRIPGRHDVRVAIERAMNTPSQRLVNVSTKVLSASGGDTATLQFSATVETVEPLYSEVGVSRYLSEIGAYTGVYDRITKILTGPGGDWIRTDAGQTTDVGSITGFVLLRESTKANARFNATGDIQARRPVNVWEIQLANVHVDAKPVGAPRGQFTGNVLLLDRPEDVQKFKASLADAQAALTKLLQSQQKYQEKVAKDESERRQTLLAKIALGTLFNGTASQGTNTPQPLWLEITDMDPDRKTIKAWLRNDGGWDDTRRFEGTFDLDVTKNLVNVVLKTDSSQRVQSGGPFVEWNETYQWSLKLDGDALAGTVGSWSCRFARLTDDTKKQEEIAFTQENATKWLAATKTGTVYKLTASIPDRAWSEEYFFTFTKQEKDGLVIEGILELPSRGFRRPFTGTLITNKYKAGGKPLRLLAKGGEAVKQANASSPLARGSDFSWYPQLDDGRMRMDAVGQPWRLEFTPTTAEELTNARLASVPATNPTQVKSPEVPQLGTSTGGIENISPVTVGTKPILPNVGNDPEQLRIAAAKGDASAQCNLGLAYLNGTGVSKNRNEAEKWLRLAADQGNAPAQFALGEMNSDKGIVNVEGGKWFKKAADQGYAPAQEVMGEINTKNGIPSKAALDWFQKAADQGNALAQYKLGGFYDYGKGVRKDYAEAAKWYRKAAEQNYADAEESLAGLYDNGLGVPKDYSESFKWHLKAAEQGNPFAEWNVAAAYSNGEGVQKNAAEALKWTRSAAKHGNADAQKYLRGQGLTW